MKPVRIYSTPSCPYCAKAKELLREEKIPYEETDLSTNPELRAALSARTGWKTVPMIFIGEQFVGGCQDLIDLKNSGRLWKLLEENDHHRGYET